MIRVIDVIQDERTLEEYAAYTHLMYSVQSLREVARQNVARLRGRTVWMVNSTEQGGGVAEMLPKLVSILRELGVDTRWAVIESDEPRFFTLTKRIHNLLHGVGDPHFSADDRDLYASVSRSLADAFEHHLEEDDLLVVHDPQPLGMGALLKERIGLPSVWRCHIGLDEEEPATRAAWEFLKPWTLAYDRTVFTVQEYVPPFLADRAALIPPAIDPLSHKNAELSTHKLTGILANASLALSQHPSITPAFETPAKRLQADGTFAPATVPEDIGLLFRPTVVQISRWDRLKGFAPLLRGFAHLKIHRDGHSEGPARGGDGMPQRHRNRLDLVRLVLAGPDPKSVQDDPEGRETFEEICELWRSLAPEVQRDVAVLVLPMDSRKINALMVNALQRCATVVAQNSLREGFGLTATEAMWKQRPVLGSRAAGLREQIRDGQEGRLVQNPEDPEEVAATLNEMLASPRQRSRWGRDAQRRVNTEYLVFSQAERWLTLLSGL